MKCKFCQAELEESVTLCPGCGQENSQTPAEEMICQEAAAEEAPVKKKISAGKLAVICVCVVALLASLLAPIIVELSEGSFGKTNATDGTVPADGSKEDVTCQGSYTVSDKKAKSRGSKVVAAAQGAELTNEQLQILYWMQVYNFLGTYGSSAVSYGLDYAKPLDQQICPLNEKGWTWQQYFLNAALREWQLYNAFCQEAEAVGYEGTVDVAAAVEKMQQSLNDIAASQGFTSIEEMVIADMGAGASLEAYLSYVELMETGNDYYAYLHENLNPTDDQIRAYYEENKADFEASGVTDDGTVLVDVRHILIQPLGTEEEESRSDAAWEACEAKAQTLFDQWQTGEKSEERFASLAQEHSEDEYTRGDGGLLPLVQEGQMTDEFNDWCFDKNRKPGDCELVKTDYGYHVIYFVQSQPTWYVYAKNTAKVQMVNDMMEDLLEKYPADVNFSKIVLGFVDLAR